MEEDDVLGIDARSLAKIEEEARKIAGGNEIDEKASIEKLAKQIYTKYTKDLGEKEKDLKKPEEEKPSFLKKILDKVNPFKDSEAEEQAKREAEALRAIEATLFVAVSKLRSNETVDSAQNDLNIVRDMVAVVEIASNSKVPPEIAQEAARAIGRVSVTTGGSENAIKQEAYEQTREVATTPLSKSIRYNLDKETGVVDFRPLVSKDHEQKRNENYAKSADALTERERKGTN